MRNSATLKEFEQIYFIKSFLFRDPNESVTVESEMGFDVEIKIDDDGQVIARLGEMETFIPYEDSIDHEAWRGIIEQLSEQPPVAKGSELQSRLDEIILLAKASKSIQEVNCK